MNGRHLLVLILDWTAAGAPADRDVPAMRQFTRWAQQLGGFLAHHRVAGFLGNAGESRQLDDDQAEWRTFLLQWARLHNTARMTAAELRRSAEPAIGGDPWDGTFPATTAGKTLSVKALGRRLTGQVGRWRGNIVLRSAIDPVSNARAYWIERQPDPSTAPESSGELSDLTRKPGNPETRQTPSH